MTQINLTVKTVWTLLAIAVFSGCAPVYLPCKAEEPQRTFHKQCSAETNTTKRGECVGERWILLESDYDVLMNRFRSCK